MIAERHAHNRHKKELKQRPPRRLGMRLSIYHVYGSGRLTKGSSFLCE